MFPILLGNDPPDPTNLIVDDIYPPQPYAQGWNNIVTELQKKLQQIPMIGPVHRFIRWVKESPESREWTDVFTYKRPGDNRETICTLLINAATSPENENSQDDSIWFNRKTTVELHFILQLEDPVSFFVWNAMLQQIANALREGDRTLNQTCLTYALPAASDSAITSFCNADAHSCIFRFLVFESGLLAVTNAK